MWRSITPSTRYLLAASKTKSPGEGEQEKGEGEGKGKGIRVKRAEPRKLPAPDDIDGFSSRARCDQRHADLSFPSNRAR